MAQGLVGMMAKIMSSGDYQVFHFDNVNHFDLLKFREYVLLIGDRSWNNYGALKHFLEAFKKYRVLERICLKLKFIATISLIT